jgi:hypothetical protein
LGVGVIQLIERTDLVSGQTSVTVLRSRQKTRDRGKNDTRTERERERESKRTIEGVDQ